MVFTSIINLVRARGPDELWRKRKIFKLSAHFIGRRRNCYSIAIKIVHRALVYATKGRKLKKADMADLWNTRLESNAAQYGMPLYSFKEGLARENILINRKMLSDLAIWEPKSFEVLANLSRQRAMSDGLPVINHPDGPIMGQIHNIIPRKYPKK